MNIVQVVVWMHGLGDTCDGWAEVRGLMRLSFYISHSIDLQASVFYLQGMPDLGIPNTKFILPTASARPISLNGGHKMPGNLYSHHCQPAYCCYAAILFCSELSSPSGLTVRHQDGVTSSVWTALRPKMLPGSPSPLRA